MSRFIKEQLKTSCIFALIVTGLIQVGILWGYQSQGTPINFILGFFNRTTQNIDAVARDRLFISDRLILSDGEEFHWIIGKNNDFYDDLWKETKQGLFSIVSGSAGLTQISEEWGDVVEKRGFLIDFGYVMKPELLTWFLGVNERKNELPDVYKIMVKPDIIDNSISVFYIYSSDGKVYISDPISYEKETDLKEVLNAVKDNTEQKYRSYVTFWGGKIGKATDEPDILYVSGAPRYWPYYTYRCIPPVKGQNKDGLAEIVLGNEKDRYNTSSNNEGTYQFNYGSNIYKYYSDGYLTYRYLGNTVSSEKGEVGEALLNAYKFIVRINGISETAADIVLTAVEEKQQGAFIFSFDYRLNGMPVKLEVGKKGEIDQKLEVAISIQANSKRVLKCDWLLRDFVQDTKGNYYDRFIDVLERTGKLFKEMEIRDIHSGYFIHSISDDVLKPELLIELKDKTTFQIEMPSEKGD